MSGQIEIVGILTPKPGNIEQVRTYPARATPPPLYTERHNSDIFEQVIEGLQPLLQYVEAHEPGVLKYQLYRQVNAASGEETLVFIEMCVSSKSQQSINIRHIFEQRGDADHNKNSFKDAETLAKHQKSEVYQQVQKAGAEQELLASPPDIKILRHVGGFGART